MTTVGDLVAVDPVRLNRLSGVADGDPPRGQVPGQRSGGTSSAPRSPAAAPANAGQQARAATALPDPVTAAGLLLEHAGTARAESRRALARLLLGLDPGLDPFATQAELAAPLGVSPGPGGPAGRRAAGRLGGSRRRAGPARRRRRDRPAGARRLGRGRHRGRAGRAPFWPHCPRPSAGTDAAPPARIAAGLLRLALDRAQALNRADAGRGAGLSRAAGTAGSSCSPPTRRCSTRRRRSAGPPTSSSRRPVGRGARWCRPGAAAQRLRDDWTRAAAGGPPPAGLGDGRLLRLAAALARDAALSGSNELYHRDLRGHRRARARAPRAGGTQAVTAHEIRDRVRARFPALPPLPDRPRLDQLMADAGLGLVYDDAERGYRWPTRAADTKGLASRQATVTVPPGPQLVSGGRSGHRLAESASTRSFLALGVDADRADRAVRALAGRFGAAVVDVTQVLIDAMRAQAAEVGLPGTWSRPPTPPRRAAATPPGSPPSSSAACPPSRRRSPRRWPAHPTGPARSLLTEVAPLARYGHLAMLSRVDRPGHPPPAGHLGARPAARRAATAPSSTGARCRSPPPASSSAWTPTGSTAQSRVTAAEGQP